MKNLNTVKLRDNVLSKIQHQYELSEIEKALDEYIDSVISNTERGVNLSVLTEHQLSVLKHYYQAIIEVIA